MIDNEETKIMNGVDPEQEIVYVKEKPLMKLLIGGIISMIGVFIFLFVVGYLMSFAGHRPPTFDKDIIRDKFDKSLGKKAISYEDCIAKDGNILETFPQQCSLSGDSFSQPLDEACANIDPSNITPVSPCAAYSPARDAGEKAGETYEKAKSGAKNFIEGFKEETNSE